MTSSHNRAELYRRMLAYLRELGADLSGHVSASLAKMGSASLESMSNIDLAHYQTVLEAVVDHPHPLMSRSLLADELTSIVRERLARGSVDDVILEVRAFQRRMAKLSGASSVRSEVVCGDHPVGHHKFIFDPREEPCSTALPVLVWRDERGRLHREDGPAVIWPDGLEQRFERGHPHPEDASAIEYDDDAIHRWAVVDFHADDLVSVDERNRPDDESQRYALFSSEDDAQRFILKHFGPTGGREYAPIRLSLRR